MTAAFEEAAFESGVLELFESGCGEAVLEVTFGEVD